MSPAHLYARFHSGQEMVLNNVINAGPLMVGTSGVDGAVPRPATGHASPPPTVGLQLSINKATDAPVTIMCALSPLPPGLPMKFTMVITGSLPRVPAPLGFPTQLGGLWAPAVLARSSDNLGDRSTLFLVGASHQVRNVGGLPAFPADSSTGLQIALGAGGASNVNPSVIHGLTDIGTAYPLGEAHHDTGDGRYFRLETDIDRDEGTGRSRLSTWNVLDKIRWPGKTSDDLQWTFNFQVTGVGFGIGMISGGGGPRANATVYDFRIYGERSSWPWTRLCRYLNLKI